MPKFTRALSHTAVALFALAAIGLGSPGRAQAVAISLAGADGDTVQVGDQVSVTVSLDTEGTTGITAASVAVLFDHTNLAYNQAASATVSEIPLVAGKGGPAYLLAANSCGGHPQTEPAGCSPQPGTTGQINVAYAASDQLSGTANTGDGQLVTLVFDVLGGGDETAEIGLSLTAHGTGIQRWMRFRSCLTP